MLRRLGQGGFADVFDLGDGTVAKVYRRTIHTHSSVRDWEDHLFITRHLHATEVAAYERLKAHPDLVDFTPRFHGTVDQALLDLPRSSSGEPYVMDCALRLEKLVGRETKAGLVGDPLQAAVDALLWKIRDVAGRVHVWDCSCFIPGPRTPFVVIDFAMSDDLSDLQLYLDEHGSVPSEMRARLSKLI